MFEYAKWIWNEQATGTDTYVDFFTQYTFEKGDSVKLRISADSNYALYLNGHFVNSGQYHDYPHHKVYDEIDLSDYILPGNNHIAFVVWYYGISSFTYCPGNAGLIFEIEKNGEIVLSSDKDVKSRKSRQYVSGRNVNITEQLGLSFCVDMKQASEWKIGAENDGFESSIIVEEVPLQLFPRETKKLIVKPRMEANIIKRGTFFYTETNVNDGQKMQYAALTNLRRPAMGTDTSDEVLESIVATSGDGIYFISDLQSESSGYVELDIEVAEDCQMIIGWGEHLEDGRCRTAVGEYDFSAVVKLRKGRNHYMNPFRRLGCRYIQFFLHTNEVKIFYAGLRPTVYPLKRKLYSSGNILRDKIYSVCQDTLMQCMHEHYEDCPWREQALYTLDSRNQMLCGYYAFEEYEFPGANLRLIARGVREDGTLPICFPTDDKLSIPAFALIYVMQVAEYYRYSCDLDTVQYCFETIKKIMNRYTAHIDSTGLLPNFREEEHFWNFYEWQPGLEGYTYRGEKYDICLNALYSLALDYYMELCELLDEDIEYIVGQKKAINCKLLEQFYDYELGLFRTCIGHDVPYSVLANALGYLCGATEGLDDAKLFDIIANNGGNSCEMDILPATLSMYTFRYEALLRRDREFYKSYIIDEIDRTYFRMLMSGATSFWETLKGERDFNYAGSLCHGWSAMPIYYYETLCE